VTVNGIDAPGSGIIDTHAGLYDPRQKEAAMQLLVKSPFDLGFWAVPRAAATRQTKVHVVLEIDGEKVSYHDLLQGTAEAEPEKRWPWGKPINRADEAEWHTRPCELCLAGMEGRPLPGRV
jgi:hypothetical protein